MSSKIRRNGERKTKECGREFNEIAALNKREPVGEGLELVRERKESRLEDKGNQRAKQNKAAGEGLELVCGTKESRSEHARTKEIQLFERVGSKTTGTSDL